MHNFLVDLVTVTIVLGIMIFVHEWGHFAAAKLCGVRVDVFSLGFGPRLFGVKRGDTDYRLSALPFGGYVRMAGDNPLEERSGAGYEFLSRPRWQRAIIAIAGPLMNFLLALVILWGIFWRLGIPSPVYEHQAADVVAVPLSMPGTGLQAGDRVTAVNSVTTPTWKKVYSEVEKAKPGSFVTLTVQRNNASQSVTVNVPEHLTSFDNLLGYASLPPVIAEVDGGTPADRAGLKPGDAITAMNGKPVVTWQQLVDGVHSSGGHSIQFQIRRDSEQLTLDITPMQGTDLDGQPVWQVGVLPNTDSRLRAPILRRSQQRRRRFHRFRHPPDRPSSSRPLQRQSFHPPTRRPSRHRAHLRRSRQARPPHAARIHGGHQPESRPAESPANPNSRRRPHPAASH